MKVINVEYDQFRPSIPVHVGDGDSRSLISPRNPIGNRLPVGPSTGDIPLRVQLTADAKQSFVGTGNNVLDLKDYKPKARSPEVCDGYTGALILVRSPIGNLDPRPPTPGDISRSIHPLAHTVKPQIRSERRMIDAQND